MSEMGCGSACLSHPLNCVYLYKQEEVLTTLKRLFLRVLMFAEFNFVLTDRHCQYYEHPKCSNLGTTKK